MLLSHKTKVRLNSDYANIIGHMCYSAYKLWNVCNFERFHYEEMGLTDYPNWYYQKKAHKNDLWFKNLPSQSAQEVCKQLDKSWKSFFTLRKNKSIENPQPPRFKHDGIVITYMQNAIVHVAGSEKVRLSLPKQLKEYMKSEYGVRENYLYLENKIFRDTDYIKQMKIYPPDTKCECEVIVIYEIADVVPVEDNGHYLSIDLGLHNLMTCYDNRGKSFIVGRQYLDICHKYDKEIARVQSQWAKAQTAKGVKYPKPSKHLLKLYEKKHNSVKDYLHKVTHYIAEYCKENGISKVIVGDLTGIREDNDLKACTNQKLHALPYHQMYIQLQYKLALNGIAFIMQNEKYSSQCPPNSLEVSAKYAKKNNRKKRGLYVDGSTIYNADSVGAYNIMRMHTGVQSGEDSKVLSSPEVIKVAV